MPVNKHQNEIKELPDINKYVMENLFPVHKDDTGKYYYNLLKTVIPPAEIESEFFEYKTINTLTPLTNLSYMFYGQIELWWLICIINHIENPVEPIPAGTTIKVIKSKYIDDILEKLRDSLK